MSQHTPYKTDEQWRASLNPEQYAICRGSATEPPFSGKWYKHKEPGTYVCVACHTPLFASESKYDSGSGWPSFFQPIKRTAVNLVPDESRGMHRTEVRCTVCDSHLGHVFPDGPKPTGLRYCINSIALDFEPDTNAFFP